MALSTPSLAEVDGADTPPTAPDAAAAPFSARNASVTTNVPVEVIAKP